MNKEEIISSIHPLIVSSIRKYALSKGDFEDLYQDGIICVMEALDKYDERRNVGIYGYLKYVLKYFYLNYGRYEKVTTSLNTQLNEDFELIDTIADGVLLIDEILIKKETLNTLHKAIKGLNLDEIQLIQELYVNNMTLDQVARLCDSNISAVFRRHRKLLDKLKALIA